MAKIMALDIGEKRIGIALSDTLNIVAQAHKTIRREDDQGVFADIDRLIKEHGVCRIIIGMPLNMNGTKGPAAEKVESFIEGLKSHIEIPVETLDERLTTAQGERILLEADISRKRRKDSIDKIAAQLILQTYLDSHVQKNNAG